MQTLELVYQLIPSRLLSFHGDSYWDKVHLQGNLCFLQEEHPKIFDKEYPQY